MHKSSRSTIYPQAKKKYKTNQTNHKMCILSILGVVDLEPHHLQLRPVEGTREDRIAWRGGWWLRTSRRWLQLKHINIHAAYFSKLVFAPPSVCSQTNIFNILFTNTNKTFWQMRHLMVISKVVFASPSVCFGWLTKRGGSTSRAGLLTTIRLLLSSDKFTSYFLTNTANDYLDKQTIQCSSRHFSE